MGNVKKIRIEVAYARTESQIILELYVLENTTIEEAIHLSGILKKYPDIDLAIQKVGVFGKLAKLSNLLRPNDRVEIYRPLLADPKEIRKNRAVQNKKTKQSISSDPSK